MTVGICTIQDPSQLDLGASLRCYRRRCHHVDLMTTLQSWCQGSQGDQLSTGRATLPLLTLEPDLSTCNLRWLGVLFFQLQFQRPYYESRYEGRLAQLEGRLGCFESGFFIHPCLIPRTPALSEDIFTNSPSGLTRFGRRSIITLEIKFNPQF